MKAIDGNLVIAGSSRHQRSLGASRPRVVDDARDDDGCLSDASASA